MNDSVQMIPELRGVDIKRDENRGDFLDEVTEDTEKNCVDKTSWQSLTRIKTYK